jgi:hypothetical protein
MAFTRCCDSVAMPAVSLGSKGKSGEASTTNTTRKGKLRSAGLSVHT